VEVVTEYSRLLSAAKSLIVALSTGLPAESRKTPLQEGGGEEWREGIRGNARTTRKKARASGRDQERIAEHYTRLDSDHDGETGRVDLE
jgi:hypothetical protein